MWEDMGAFDAKLLKTADPVYRRWLRTHMKNGRLTVWIVEAKGAPIASGALWIMQQHPRPNNPTGEVPYLLSMYTDPHHRGKGHAKRIVKAAIKYARAGGYGRISLHASKFGRPVYKKLGFERSWEMRLEL